MLLPGLLIVALTAVPYFDINLVRVCLGSTARQSAPGGLAAVSPDSAHPTWASTPLLGE